MIQAPGATDYLTLAVANRESDGKVGEILVRFGAAPLTCCPECRYEAFKHQQQCLVPKMILQKAGVLPLPLTVRTATFIVGGIVALLTLWALLGLTARCMH
jgi:hypothetical protein